MTEQTRPDPQPPTDGPPAETSPPAPPAPEAADTDAGGDLDADDAQLNLGDEQGTPNPYTGTEPLMQDDLA